MHNKMKKYLSHERGFSLVEMLLYMGIFSILLVTLMRFFGSILDVKLESEATSSVTQDGRFITSRLSYDIHRASSIVSPAIGNSAASLQIIVDGTNYTYSLDGNNNLLITNPTVDQLNSADTTISNLNFTTLGISGGTNNTVQVSFIIKSKVIKTGGNNQTETFQTTIGTR